MAIDLKSIEDYDDVKALKKELAAFRKKSLKFLADAKTEADSVKRAKILIVKLQKADFFKDGGRQCPPGTVWDPVTKTCV